jgi:hypothetical protein
MSCIPDGADLIHACSSHFAVVCTVCVAAEPGLSDPTGPDSCFILDVAVHGKFFEFFAYPAYAADTSAYTCEYVCDAATSTYTCEYACNTATSTYTCEYACDTATSTYTCEYACDTALPATRCEIPIVGPEKAHETASSTDL